jgi:hypothetical protein
VEWHIVGMFGFSLALSLTIYVVCDVSGLDSVITKSAIWLNTVSFDFLELKQHSGEFFCQVWFYNCIFLESFSWQFKFDYFLGY